MPVADNNLTGALMGVIYGSDALLLKHLLYHAIARYQLRSDRELDALLVYLSVFDGDPFEAALAEGNLRRAMMLYCIQGPLSMKPLCDLANELMRIRGVSLGALPNTLIEYL